MQTHLGSWVRSEKPVRLLRRLKSNCSSFDVLADYPITRSQLWSVHPGSFYSQFFILLSLTPSRENTHLLLSRPCNEEPVFFRIPPVESPPTRFHSHSFSYPFLLCSQPLHPLEETLFLFPHSTYWTKILGWIRVNTLGGCGPWLRGLFFERKSLFCPVCKFRVPFFFVSTSKYIIRFFPPQSTNGTVYFIEMHHLVLNAITAARMIEHFE